MELCNEELVRNPEELLKAVTNFLGEDYSPAMLTYHETSSDDPPDVNLLNQWKKKLSAREIQFVEAGMQEEIVARGYAVRSGK